MDLNLVFQREVGLLYDLASEPAFGSIPANIRVWIVEKRDVDDTEVHLLFDDDLEIKICGNHSVIFSNSIDIKTDFVYQIYSNMSSYDPPVFSKNFIATSNYNIAPDTCISLVLPENCNNNTVLVKALYFTNLEWKKFETHWYTSHTAWTNR